MPWVRIRGSPPGDFHAAIELAVNGGLQQIGTAF